MRNKSRLLNLIVGVVFLSPLFVSGQGVRPGDRRTEVEPETMDDPYLPNAYNNTKTSPAYKYISVGSSRSLSSSIFTIQVNVDSNGHNILGDAGNEPNIAVNPLNDSEIVIGWRQFDNVASNFRQAGWSFTSDAGQSWTFPGVIDSGVFHSDPVLDYDADGNFYYNSLRSDFTTKVYESSNGGATWGAGTDAGGGDKQWMAIDRTGGVGRGNIYSFWTAYYSTCYPGNFTRSTNGNASYESCTTVSGNPSLGTMAVGNTGELYICGNGQSANKLVVAKSVNAQTPGSVISWNFPVQVNMDGSIGGASVNPAGLLGQANIDVDHASKAGAGTVYLLAAVARYSNPDPGDVMFAKSTDGGAVWGSPKRINDDVSQANTQWMGTMSVAPNGRIDAVWLDTRDDPSGGDSSALYYSYSTDQGNTWSANEKMSASFNPHVGYPDQDKMGDYFDMVSDNIGANLAWANTLNGEEDVYYSRIVPPITTGISQLANNLSFAVSPNPTGGVFVLTSESKQCRMEIYNMLGGKMHAQLITKTKSEIDISSQPAGIYFLKMIYEDGSSAVKKIVRE